MIRFSNIFSDFMPASRSKRMILLWAIIFTLIFIMAPMVHNHKDPFHEPANCPANIIQVTIISFFLITFLNFALSHAAAFPIIHHIKISSQFFLNHHIQRAPPA